jgi:hypothetical protein
MAKIRPNWSHCPRASATEGFTGLFVLKQDDLIDPANVVQVVPKVWRQGLKWNRLRSSLTFGIFQIKGYSHNPIFVNFVSCVGFDSGAARHKTVWIQFFGVPTQNSMNPIFWGSDTRHTICRIASIGLKEYVSTLETSFSRIKDEIIKLVNINFENKYLNVTNLFENNKTNEATLCIFTYLCQ